MTKLNVELVRARVPNITRAAEEAGVRPAAVFELMSGKTMLDRAHVGTLMAIAEMAHCGLDELVVRELEMEVEDFATSIASWTAAAGVVKRRLNPGAAEVIRTPEDRVARMKRFPETPRPVRSNLKRTGPYAI
jgi:hypothetical protein